MDINNPEYCRSLSAQATELPNEFSNAVQVKNSTAALVTITEDVQLMPYAYAIVSPNNKRLEKLTAAKKIKIVPFAINSSATLDVQEEAAPKKKRQSKSSKSTSSPHLEGAVAELASIVATSVDQDKEEPVELEAEIQPTENNLLEDGNKGAPEDNNESV